MKTIKNIFAQEKRIIDAINKEGQTLINTTSFEEWDKWDNIEDRLEQISKRRRRVFNISRALRDQEHARMDCIAGIYDKFYRTDDGQAYDEAWQAQNQITQNETVTFLYTE